MYIIKSGNLNNIIDEISKTHNSDCRPRYTQTKVTDKEKGTNAQCQKKMKKGKDHPKIRDDLSTTM